MDHLKDLQYSDSSKFNARIYLHARFGTNRYSWPKWVFDNFRNGENLKVLEIGCGSGLLWRSNARRIPGSWEIILTDFSEGMLDDARKSIGSSANNISFEVVNVEDIPCGGECFDMVIANHMLYHVPDRGKALSGISRILKNDGAFYATTMRSGYMNEMREIIEEYASTPASRIGRKGVIANFSIENGRAQLCEYFSDVELKIYKNSLIVDEAAPFVDYAYSCIGMDGEKTYFNERERSGFTEFVEDRIRKNDGIVIPSDFGLFICTKPIRRRA